MITYKSKKIKKSKTKKNNKSIKLSPKHEAALLAYIVLYYNCDKSTCWKLIGKIIEENGKLLTKTVYRGHGKNDKRIINISPFFSTSPLKSMAELFVETEWSENDEESPKRVGHLFKIHLDKVPTINTKDIKFTYSKEVLSELKKINKNRPIEKGEGTFTFEEYIPKLKSAVHDLVYTNSLFDEILVLNGGTFYANKECTKKGFAPLANGDFETYYKMN